MGDVNQGEGSRERLLVCRACGGLRDPVTIHPGLRQRCDCERSEEQARWPGYDFNMRHELCRLCGATASQSGHKFAVWFCEPCRLAVRAANDRLDGYVIPIGRHSIHGARASRGASAEQAARLAEFIQGMPERMRLLLRWRRARVRELWIAADLAPDEEVGLERFEAAVRPEARDPEDLVAALLEHLTRPI